jgi:hypothetical protein
VTDTERLLTERMDLAWTEFEPLRDAYNALQEKWQQDAVTEAQPDGVTYLVKARVSEVDPLLRIKTGAVIHQIRATLDNLAWALATRVKAEPGNVSFPIARNLNDFHGFAWVSVLGTSAPCVVAAERLQPYNRTEGNVLHVLHRLWNLDKHRVPPVLPIVPTKAFIFGKAGETSINAQTKFYPVRRGKTVNNDQVLIRIVVPSTADEPPTCAVALRPALNVPGPETERQLPQALFNMYHYVRYEVMPALTPFL